MSHISGSTAVAIQQMRQLTVEGEIQQVESEQDFLNMVEEAAFNPVIMARRFRTLEEQRTAQAERQATKEKIEDRLIQKVENTEEAASEFQEHNDELQAKVLLILRSRLKSNSTSDEVFDIVRDTYADVSLADEALDFLLVTTEGDLHGEVAKAKEKLVSLFDREIRAGRNMGEQARVFSKMGLGSPTSLRDLYREITGSPREPLPLFDLLSDKFRYEQLKTAIQFFLHSLASDLRAKGPSLSRPELKRLMDDIRSLQGILGVYRFFQGRMPLMVREFQSYHLAFPGRLNFESLAKLFVKMLAEKYLSPDRIQQTAAALGISAEVAAQIVVYSQMRDALRNIAPRFFRNPQHRDDLLKHFLDLLEKLEEQYEEEEEKK